MQSSIGVTISNQTLLKQMLSAGLCCYLPLHICFRIAPADVVARVQDQLYRPITRSFPQIDTPTWSYAMLSFVFEYHIFIRKLLPTAWLDHSVSMMSNACTSSEEIRKLQYLISNESHNLSHFQKAVVLMEIVENEHLDTFGLCQLKLGKEFLRRALKFNDSERDSVHYLTQVYLAVLQYTEGRYQKATDHCTLVTRSQGHSQRSLHVVQENALPKIDDDIDSAAGLVVLYQYVRKLASVSYTHLTLPTIYSV